jgi:hypothetical protein
MSFAPTITDSAPPARAAAAPTTRRRRLDWFEWATLTVFLALSAWVLAIDLWHMLDSNWVWTGADGLYGVDQFQYMAWIQDASRHLLISNLFVLQSTPRDYFQPAIALSGGLSALGLSPVVSLLLWKPVAVVALFFAIRGYVNRTLAETWARRAALVLALFFGSFTVVYGAVGAIGDLFPPFLSWGYPFGLLGLAAMVGGLLSYVRSRQGGKLPVTAGVLGAIASLLHPWNGAMLIAVTAGGELIAPRPSTTTKRWLLRPIVTAAMTCVPLAYYVLLGRIDLSWRLARGASKHGYPLWAIALELAPLLLPAALACRKRPQTFLDAAGMVWLLAAFGVFLLSLTRFAATPVHAFQGITIPLAVLAVQGLRGIGFSRLPHPVVWASVLIAAFTIPTTVWQMNTARKASIPRVGDSNFITRDENRALHYLVGDPRAGGVIARQYLGQLVPAKTGRRTYVGDCLWSQPDCRGRQGNVKALFAGDMSRAAATRLIRLHGARFLLTDCRQTADLQRLLGGVITGVHRFGCATVYDVE